LAALVQRRHVHPASAGAGTIPWCWNRPRTACGTALTSSWLAAP